MIYEACSYANELNIDRNMMKYSFKLCRILKFNFDTLTLTGIILTEYLGGPSFQQHGMYGYVKEDTINPNPNI